MRRTLLLLAAMLVAAVGTVLVYLYVRGADTRALADQKTVTVYLASRSVPANTQVTADLFKAQVVPRVAQVPGAVTETGTVQGKYLQVPVVRGQQLLTEMFGAETASGVSKGQAAVSVQVTDVNRVAAMLQKGSRVMIYSQHGGELKSVLPAPATVSAIGGTNLPPTVITFVLAEDQAIELAKAQALGDPLVFIIVG